MKNIILVVALLLIWVGSALADDASDAIDRQTEAINRQTRAIERSNMYNWNR